MMIKMMVVVVVTRRKEVRMVRHRGKEDARRNETRLGLDDACAKAGQTWVRACAARAGERRSEMQDQVARGKGELSDDLETAPKQTRLSRRRRRR